MAKRTLYETAQTWRKLAIYILIGALGIIAIDALIKTIENTRDPFSAGFSFYLQRNPQDQTKIPELPLTTLQISNDDPTFLVEGVFPQSPDTAFVYTVERPKVKLDYETKAVATATALGFAGSNYTSLNGSRNTDLLWENRTKTRKLKYNAETLTWQLRTFYFEDGIALQPKVLLPNIDSYFNVAAALAQKIGLNSGFGFENEVATAVYARLGNDALFTNPANPNNASYVVADIFRRLPLARLKPEAEFPELPEGFVVPPQLDGNVYKEDPRFGSIHMVVGDKGADSAKDIYELDLIDFEYRTSPLVRDVITAEEAWTKVRQGEGKLRLLKTDTADHFQDSEVLGVRRFVVDAGRTEMGYYEPVVWDGFVYPIYIFRGRVELTNGLSGKFVFYMDALNRDIVNFN